MEEEMRTLCPGPVVIPQKCSYRGCRAPQLATGKALQEQRDALLHDRDPCLHWVVACIGPMATSSSIIIKGFMAFASCFLNYIIEHETLLGTVLEIKF